MDNTCVHHDLCKACLEDFGYVETDSIKSEVPCIYTQNYCDLYGPIMLLTLIFLNGQKILEIQKDICEEWIETFGKGENHDAG